MQNNIVSHIKFTIKDGCVEDFLKAVKKIDSEPQFANYSGFAGFRSLMPAA